MFDPGLAPLGTDDEAAGAQVDPKLVTEIRERERRDAPVPPYPASRRAPLPTSHRTLAIGVGLLFLLPVAGILVWRWD